jgi:hypothetical protein
MAAQCRPEQPEPAFERAAAIRERPARAVLGRIGPALGGDGVAEERMHTGSEHGNRRVPLDQVVVVEPVEPPLEGDDAAAVVRGKDELGDQPGGTVGVARRHGIVDGGLR